MDQQKTLLKSRNAIMKFLPRATSSVTFQSPPIYSPAKDKRSSEKTGHKSNLGIGFSGPLVSSMIPVDTRRKIINKKSDYGIVYEPTSPRVSCMGQVRCKYQKDKLQTAKNTLPANKVIRLIDTRTHNFDDHHEETPKTGTNKSKKKLGFKKIFSGVSTFTPKSVRKNIKDISKGPLYLDDNKVPNLSTMKRFTSGRGKFSSFDWTKEVARMDGEESDDEQLQHDVIVMPSSAPVVIRNSLGFDDKFIRVAGINKEPKKEINLWKRRTLPQPKPIQVNGI
uniref:uncharacterized protein At1g76070-like n=1 Tax=Erigeron canadensis TaxID=72917 RepID=UPI001CB98A6C|nr:uncharacterized protein At1g76070-like [Erigeron canadensis]